MMKKIFRCYHCDKNNPCILVVEGSDNIDTPHKCPYGWYPGWDEVELQDVKERKEQV